MADFPPLLGCLGGCMQEAPQSSAQLVKLLSHLLRFPQPSREVTMNNHRYTFIAPVMQQEASRGATKQLQQGKGQQLLTVFWFRAKLLEAGIVTCAAEGGSARHSDWKLIQTLHCKHHRVQPCTEMRFFLKWPQDVSVAAHI
ncbi:hypothetical protein KIL84_003650 [Mauremys mutica]|uniref:Uncharacterized protein n=1 Tax=Mauremys mutica TaxID=74926 RepID=A0A9D3WW55_9SAUR|nr:hypothetical protein KIL84_003650 [Mauremys mutica]